MISLLNKIVLIFCALIFCFSCREEEEFSSFFDNFKTIPDFQKKRLWAKVNIYQIPENDSIVKVKLFNKINRKEIDFIDLNRDFLYSKKKYIEKDEGFKVKIKQTKDSVVYSQLGLGDNLLNYNYVFKKRDKKWYLTDIHELTP